MYVAMTRAREKLYIARAKERYYYGNYISNPASRFIAEIPEQMIEIKEIERKWFFWSFWTSPQPSPDRRGGSYNASPTKKIVREMNDIDDFKMWTRVKHPKFGDWIITSLNWNIWEIAFSWEGIKKMNVEIAPIEVI